MKLKFITLVFILCVFGINEVHCAEDGDSDSTAKKDDQDELSDEEKEAKI